MEFSEGVFRLDKNLYKIPVGESYSRFSAEPLEKAIKKVVLDITKNENTPLADEDDSSCPVFVLATIGENANGPIKLFKSYGYYRDQCPIWQAAQATTAAPTFFPPAWVDVPSPGRWYVDGGVKQNNPSPLGLEEGKDHWRTARRCLVVSIGTGVQVSADLVKDPKPPRKGGRKESRTTNDTLDSDQRGETGNADQRPDSEQRRKSLFSGTGRTLRKVVTKLGGPLQPVADKAVQVARIPGGINTATRFLKELAKLSTESEDTHNKMWKAANSEDKSLQFPYYRFNVSSGMERIGLEEWRRAGKIISMTQGYFETAAVRKEMEECAKKLLNPSPFECT
jgi:predicted acylesterase/phospholipase RssA